MKKFLISTAVIALTSTAASAHHGTSGQFDPTKIIEIGGTITKMAFVNPHSYVYFDVVEPDGQTVNWNCELRASSVMRRSGWTKEMFAVGTQIEIVGVVSRKDAKGCYVETISFNGSAPIKRYEQITEGKLKPVETRPAVTAWGDPNIAGDWAATQRLHGVITARNATKIEIDELEDIVAQNKNSEQSRRRRNGSNTSYTLAAKAFIAAQSAKSVDGVTGRLDCSPRDFFTDWTYDQPANGIVQTEDTIILKYGFMDTVRTVHLGQSEFPDDIQPSWAGYSIGNWENNILTVQTRGFTAGGGDRGGYHSEDYYTVEKFTLNTKENSLTRSYEASDPTFWSANDRVRGQDIVYLSEVPFEPYNCDDRSVE